MSQYNIIRTDPELILPLHYMRNNQRVIMPMRSLSENKMVVVDRGPLVLAVWLNSVVYLFPTIESLTSRPPSDMASTIFLISPIPGSALGTRWYVGMIVDRRSGGGRTVVLPLFWLGPWKVLSTRHLYDWCLLGTCNTDYFLWTWLYRPAWGGL